MKLAKLDSKVATLDTRRVASLVAGGAGSENQRLRGRAGVERRKRFLNDNPLCVACIREGRAEPSTVPDHKVPLWDGGPDTVANLQALCKRHHDAKSAAEAAERSRRARA